MNNQESGSHFAIANSTLMLVLCATVILFVTLQAVLFYKKTYARGKEIGVPEADMKKVVVNTAIFSIIPSSAILLFFILLVPGLGTFFPWLRLSVIGSGLYENLIATSISAAAGFENLTQINLEVYIVIMFTMTFAIMASPLLTVFVLKPFIGKITELEKQKDGFGPQIVPAVFAGLMISTFMPLISPKVVNVDGASTVKIPFIAIGAFVASAISVTIFNKVAAKYNKPVLRDFAFPISIFVGMIVAVILNLMGVK